MLVLSYGIAALLQMLACFGSAFALHKAFLSRIESKFSFHLAFLMSVVVESTLLGVLFLHFTVPLRSIQGVMLIKIILGLFFLYVKWSIFSQFIKENLWLFLIYLLVFFNACVPTSCYDAFTAHFQVPKYFLEYLAYPIRPDFQYLDALPLGVHMLYVLPLSLKLEGGVNVYSLIFMITLFDLFTKYSGKKIGLISILLCLSMPQFIRVAMDPMVDVPNFYFVVLGVVFMKHRHELRVYYYGLALSWSFLMCIKPTMLVFPLMLTSLIIYDFIKKDIKIEFVLKLALCMAVVGLFWQYKTYIIHGNPFYPYFGEGIVKPLVPKFDDVKPLGFENFINYLMILFFDHRYFLTYGPWIFICLPLLVLKKSDEKNDYIIYFLVVLGFVLTFLTTSFKNRYFMPYLFLLLPLFASRLQEASLTIKHLLKVWVFFVFLTYLPYFLQPLHAGLKNLTKSDYYQRKFSNYSIINNLNTEEHGKVFFVGSPVYWLNCEHIVSIYSETHLDYTRINTIELLFKRLKDEQIDTVCVDLGQLEGMSRSKSPYYQKNKYLATQCLLLWQKALESDRLSIIKKDAQVVVAKFQFR